MDNDKLNKQFEMYKELAKDKKIDVASLMLNALESKETNNLPLKQKRWAYLVSLGFPPFGLLFSIKFYFSGKDDGVETALQCAALTAISILILVVTFKILLAGSGLTPTQIQSLDPQDLQGIYGE